MFSQWSERAHLCDSMAFKAFDLFKQHSETFDNRDNAIVQSVCFFLACQSELVPYSIKDVMSITGTVNRKHFLRILYTTTPKYIFQSDFLTIISKYQYDLDISRVEKYRLARILKESESSQMQGFRPLAVFATVFWCLRQETNKVSLTRIHSITGVSASCVSRLSKIFKKGIKK